MKKMRELDHNELRCVMMQIARAKIVLNYWTCYVRDIKYDAELKRIYRHELKRKINNALKHADVYMSDLNNTFSADVVDAIDDQVAKFYDWKGNVVFCYEQAVKRALDKMKYPNSEFLMHCAVSKDLVSVAAAMLGMEAAHMRTSMREVGDLPMEHLPAAHRIVAPEEKMAPTTMATMLRVIESVNMAILKELKLENARIENGFDAEIERSLDICSKNIIDFFTEYDVWMVMLEKKDMTVERAIEIVNERKEKAANDGCESSEK